MADGIVDLAQASMAQRNMTAVLTVQFQVGVITPTGMLIMPLPEFRDKAAINPWEHGEDAKSFEQSVGSMWRRWATQCDQFVRGPDFRNVAVPTLLSVASNAALMADIWEASK